MQQLTQFNSIILDKFSIQNVFRLKAKYGKKRETEIIFDKHTKCYVFIFLVYTR